MTPQVQTPFLAAILGPSGAGKTFALRRLAQTIEQLSASSGRRSGQAVQRVVLARVDASIGVEAPVAIASAAYAALDRESGDVDYSGLLDEIRHAGGDPHRAASAASDRHDDLVRKLEAERAQRDEVEAKRARLADALAFDTPGSRSTSSHALTVAPSKRSCAVSGWQDRTQTRAIAIWRETSRPSAPAAASGVVIRSIWAYGSQARLLLWGVFAFVLAFILRFSARPNGDRRDRARKRFAEACRGLGGGARRLVRSSGADLIHSRSFGHRAQSVARAWVLEPSVARLPAVGPGDA